MFKDLGEFKRIIKEVYKEPYKEEKAT